MTRASINDAGETTDDLSEIPEEDKKPAFKPVYAFFVLALVLICRIMVQWHR